MKLQGRCVLCLLFLGTMVPLYLLRLLSSPYDRWPLVYETPGPGYSGYIVPDWPPDRDRNMSVYVRPDNKDTFPLVPDMDLVNTEVVVVVQSGDIMADRREADRATWARQVRDYPGVRVVFHVGVGEDARVRERVQQEARRHRDILQVGTTTLASQHGLGIRIKD